MITSCLAETRKLKLQSNNPGCKWFLVEEREFGDSNQYSDGSM